MSFVFVPEISDTYTMSLLSCLESISGVITVVSVMLLPCSAVELEYMPSGSLTSKEGIVADGMSSAEQGMLGRFTCSSV